MTDAPKDETGRVRAIWDRLAPRYDRASRYESLLIGDGRAWATRQARGQTLEIGVGTGRNLPLYRADVRVTAIDLSPGMLALARRVETAVDVDLRIGDAQELDFDDAAFDTVLATLVLCSVPDDRRALAEAYRVLRPGGRLVLVEHVRSHLAPVRSIERALDGRSVRGCGDHLLRDPLDHLEALGFQVVEARRSRLGAVERIVAERPPSR